MTTAPKTANGVAILSTWQWLGVIVAILGGTAGIDMRMQSAVGGFAAENNADHERIRDELRIIAATAAEGGREIRLGIKDLKIPPVWLENKVSNQGNEADELAAIVAESRADIRNLQTEVTALRTIMDEIRVMMKEIKNNMAMP